MSEAAGKRVELTIRGLVLGCLITVVFTAANVYLGLRVGLTFASSIPAAVISMALLRALKTATIWENNIVQTVASAAGTLSSIIFVLPGLVMVGWWTGFPFWQSFWICVIGGVLGVMYTIPLRRALVTTSDLPYPEGRAAAEVLKVGSGAPGSEGAEEVKAGLAAVIVGSRASAAAAAAIGMRLMTDTLAVWFRPTPTTATGMAGGLQLALIGAGHLMGIAVGMAMLVGLVIAWGVAVPILTAMHPVLTGTAEAAAKAAWAPNVRFIGAGAIGVAAVWTLGKLAAPVWAGLIAAMRAAEVRKAGQGETLPIVERDMPIGIVAGVTLASLVPLAILFHGFLSAGPLQSVLIPLIVGGVLYVVVAGFLVAAVCGYMAGLIGSSNSPVSGLAILSVLGASLLLVLLAAKTVGPTGEAAMVAYALFVTAVLLNVATIANDNLQDLKTGQLVDATPWKQQAALIVGVLAGAVVIPPILDLLNHAFGFAGAANLNTISKQPLAAPQAVLISTLAKGVIQGDLPWRFIGVGAGVGVVLVIVDELLRTTKRFSLPPLGVGIAIYLPAAVTLPVAIGAVVGWAYDRSVAGKPHGPAAQRLGVLLASGFIVGESLFNVALAGLIVATNNPSPIAVVPESFPAATAWLAALVIVALVAGTYLWTERRARALPA
ncbi:MAG: OPT family oligopeptide transporter [Phenylobacterium sp.]